ncbi:hypothetical protein P8452_05971 [Trifolium repens]|nr:hypothetical protein P8452_05971 [Trifolium repens]
MLDDSEWLPEVSEDASIMDWLDAVPDPDYIPVEPEASIVVESNYNLRRRTTTDNPNMSKVAAYVCPPNIQELQKPHVIVMLCLNLLCCFI